MAGDVLMLTGMGVSPAGILPFFRFGITQVTLDESVEIGNESFPFGVVWFSVWYYSTKMSPYNANYGVRLIF